MQSRILFGALILTLMTACQAQVAETTQDVAKTASTNPNACPTYDVAGSWKGLTPTQYAQNVTGTFSKDDCTITLSYCNTTLTFSNASNPAFSAWGTIDVVVQADGSVPPTCMQAGEYRGCATTTAYNGQGIRQWAINCASVGGLDRTLLKQ